VPAAGLKWSAPAVSGRAQLPMDAVMPSMIAHEPLSAMWLTLSCADQCRTTPRRLRYHRPPT
jgi:hypothetical protein